MSHLIDHTVMDGSRTTLALMLALALVVQAASWQAPCTACGPAGEPVSACHAPAPPCADHALQTGQLADTCCCAITACSDPEQEPPAAAVVEPPVQERTALADLQAVSARLPLRSVPVPPSSCEERIRGPAPPLFVLNSSYLI